MSAALVVSFAAACAAVPSLACGEKKGALMLAISTDMRAPKDVNIVSITIKTGTQIRHNFIGYVRPDGTVELPATLAIVESEDPNPVVSIRVIAFKDKKARVLSDITTTVPKGRVALLRMPMSFINDGSGTGAIKDVDLPKNRIASFGGNFGSGNGDSTIFFKDLRLTEFNPFEDVVSSCAPEQTMIEGECVSARVDSSTLPDFDQLLVTRADKHCFSCSECFGSWREISDVNLNDCTAPKEPDVTNVGLISETGDCDATGKCFVPIDKTTNPAAGTGSVPLDGWKDDASAIRLPKGVCKKLREGAKLAYVGGTRCEAKTASFPVCAGASGTSSVDGGVADASVADSDADASVPSNLVVAADNPTAVAVTSATETYFGTNQGLFVHQQPAVSGSLVGNSPQNIAGPWFIARLGAILAFGDGTPFKTAGGADVRGYRLINQNISSLTFATGGLEIGATVKGVALKAGRIFFATSGPTVGDLYTVDTSCCSTAQPTSSYGDQTAVAYAPATDMVITGGATGGVHLVSAGSLTTFDFVDVEAGNPFAVEGLATAEALPGPDIQAYALRTDAVWVLNKVGTQFLTSAKIVSAVGSSLNGIMVGGVYHPRTITAVPKCAFFSSSRGVEWVTSTGLNEGVLVTIADVLGVAVPPGAPDSVYFAVHRPASAGGGIYREKIPMACR